MTSTSVDPPSAPVKLEPPTPSRRSPLPPPPPPDADVVYIPTYSKWFSYDTIHDCETRFLPEFFDSRSPSKNPRIYMYYRNSIVKHSRKNPSSKITFSEVRKSLAGDVGSIRRVFDFLETWGLINYSPSAVNKPLKWEDKESKSSGADAADSTPPKRESSKRLCSGCKSVCTIACFVCDKYELTLCARCYVRGNYRVGVGSSDFRRVEISEETRTEWTEKETLQLLEAVTHFGDDWRKVSLHVPGRSEKGCVSHFIKLPFGDQFAGYADLGKPNEKDDPLKDRNDADNDNGLSPASKRMCLSPLADASNPIMGQLAFLSALAGTEVAEAAAQAAIAAFSDVELKANKAPSVASHGDNNQIGSVDAKSMLEKEEAEAKKAISSIVEVQMREIQDKIDRFEEMDFVMEKERKQCELMKNLLFVDQLLLFFHKKEMQKTVEQEDNTRTN